MSRSAAKHVRSSGLAIAIACLGLGACSKHADDSAAQPRKPHTVVLISVDTLRADRLGCYGYKRPTSPHLDRLAAESVLFANATAQSSFTLVSHKSLFTSKYPLRLVRENTNGDLKALASLQDPHQFLVHTFRKLKSELLIRGLGEGGYRTAAFTDGVWMSRWFEFDQGFDRFDDSRGHLKLIIPRALNWLPPNRKDPVFLFLHTYDTHCPYPCREPFSSMFCRDHSKHIPLEGRCNQVTMDRPPLMKVKLAKHDLRAISDHYDGGVACADADLGSFFDSLRALNLYDDALIILTSDHGESLGEHDQIGHGGLYLEQLRVPLIMKFPTSWRIKPRIIEEPVELVDIMPTAYDACGLVIPQGIDGRSLMPLIRRGEWQRRFAIAQTTHQEGRDAVTNAAKRAVLVPGEWLLIHDARADRVELFDLAADPLGLVAVNSGRPEAVGNLLAALKADDPGPSTREFVVPDSMEMSDELRRQLETLGYIGG